MVSNSDGFEIEAVSRNDARVSYATSLMKKGVLISTTEHVLSAFIGLGIDKYEVERQRRVHAPASFELIDMVLHLD